MDAKSITRHYARIEAFNGAISDLQATKTWLENYAKSVAPQSWRNEEVQERIEENRKKLPTE